MDDLKAGALEVLLHNIHGPFEGLPRTAGWGYPEPYTRDWMIAALGILVSHNEELIAALRKVLIALAEGQSSHGSIASLANDPSDTGASDTAPLFLIALALFRSVTGETGFLEEAAQKCITWLRYQRPDDGGLTAQQPTSDWRDEQWVPGYGLYVNALVYAGLKLHGLEEQSRSILTAFNQPVGREQMDGHHPGQGLALRDLPYYALWSYKVHHSPRFDLPGNSLAILFGLADQPKANRIIDWVESAIHKLNDAGKLGCDLPPCLMPFIQSTDGDWLPRYERFNRPGHYHNGGLWPFTIGLYVAALTAAGRHDLAAQKLDSLGRLVQIARNPELAFGFNEWLGPQDCSARGEDWQTWSAALYLYAAECVEQRKTPLVEMLRPVQ